MDFLDPRINKTNSEEITENKTPVDKNTLPVNVASQAKKVSDLTPKTIFNRLEATSPLAPLPPISGQKPIPNKIFVSTNTLPDNVASQNNKVSVFVEGSIFKRPKVNPPPPSGETNPTKTEKTITQPSDNSTGSTSRESSDSSPSTSDMSPLPSSNTSADSLSTLTENTSGKSSLSGKTPSPVPEKRPSPQLSEKEKLLCKSLGIDHLPVLALKAIAGFYEDKKATILNLSKRGLTKDQLPECLFTNPEFKNRMKLILLDDNNVLRRKPKETRANKTPVATPHRKVTFALPIEAPNSVPKTIFKPSGTTLPPLPGQINPTKKHLQVKEDPNAAKENIFMFSKEKSHPVSSITSREIPPLLSEKEKLLCKSLGIDKLPVLAQKAITRFYENKKATSLSLSGLKLTKLPECLFTHPEFNRIESLLLDSNDFIEFPVEILSLSNLKAVNLINNKITSIPKEFQHSKLEWLHLSGNPIRNPIIDHSKLPNLKGASLDISSPSLGEINLDNLWEFPVAAQEKIVAYLDINNRDKSSLDLSNCGLESIPRDIFSQPPFLEKLENLNLRGNSLKEFPKEILSLPKLKELNLSHNQIEEFDTSNLTHPNLETLNVSENPIDSGITIHAKNPTYFKGSPILPKSFPKLKSFIISYYNRKT